MKISFKPLKKSFLPTLHQWFNQPHVKKWYARDKQYTLAEIEEKYLPRIQNSTNIPNYIAYLDDEPIGYIQLYSLKDYLPDDVQNYKHSLFRQFNPHELMGLDIFFAVEKYLGKGISSNILQEFLHTHITEEIKALIVDPLKSNTHAIKFFERNQFELISNNSDSGQEHTLMINLLLIPNLFSKYKLGKVIAKPEKLNGGALHQMWKINTSDNTFAIKEINPYITKKETFKIAYEASEQIAETFHARGIPSIPAIAYKKHYVLEYNQSAYLVYPFVAAQFLPPQSLTTHHAKSIADVLKKMHAFQISNKHLTNVHYDKFNNQHWIELIKKAKIKALTQLQPSILEWNTCYQASISELNKNLLITHRDMHAQNVLWDAHNKPYIIDWESAGLMNPIMEIIGCALEWSGIILDATLNEQILHAMLTSYFKRNSSISNITSVETAFYGWLGNCVLGWTEFNIRRRLGLTSELTEEKDLGDQIIINHMIPCLEFIQSNQEKILTLLNVYAEKK